MKYCVKCGASNPDSAKFCTECGASLALNETTSESEIHTSEISADENTSYTYGEPSNTAASSDNADTEVLTYDVVEKTNNENHNKEDKYTYTYDANSGSHTSYSTAHPGIAPRNIVVAIILSIVTCGIYQLYWMFKMNEEVNVLASEPNATSGGLVIVFHFITCGIYGIYWSYKMGERCDRIKGSVGGSSAILYLILTLLGFGIVTFCLIQDTINKAV